MAYSHGVTPSGSAVMRCVAAVAVVATGLFLAACAPELNWRTVQAEEAHGLAALFPCKPDRFERKVPWPGVPEGVTMRLLSCQAQAKTWALSYVTMPDVTVVEPALRQWPEITRENLTRASASVATSAQAVRAQNLGPVTVPRMTPSNYAHAWYFEGTRPQAQEAPTAIGLHAWHFVHGMTVFQASVSGAPAASDPQSSEDVAQAFLRSFHFPD